MSKEKNESSTRWWWSLKMTINGKKVEWSATKKMIYWYLFFLVHMLVFWVMWFVMSYAVDPTEADTQVFSILFSWLAIVAYMLFYYKIFGREKIQWMAFNALIGIPNTYWLLEQIVTTFNLTSWSSTQTYQHIIPGIYIVLYIFLVRHMCIDFIWLVTKDNNEQIGNGIFLLVSLIIFFGWTVWWFIMWIL